MNSVDGQLSIFGHDIWSGKTSQAHSAAEKKKAKTFSPSSRKSLILKAAPFLFIDLTPGHGDLLGQARWELISPSLGGAWMLNTGVCPSVDCACSLSQILQDSVPRKYYLSRSACLGILRRAKVRNKPLPVQLKLALELQAGVRGSIPARKPKPPHAFHINQRDEAIDLGETAGALMATANMQMQTFVTQEIILPDEGQESGEKIVASFSAGAGSAAGGIAYSEQVTPTLKAAQSGNMMPTILCLNDQGGSVMECSENVSGTLRAQEHGHQPLVLYENHGIDSRYRGPLDVAPTMSARYGTGGNNVPLVGTEMFSRSRVDKFQPSDVASTESARQHKDATDLVYQETVKVPSGDEDDGRPLLIRRLTPLECERLQGFPDHWTDIPQASDSARYKALGNSVAIPCVSYIMRRITAVTALSA